MSYSINIATCNSGKQYNAKLQKIKPNTLKEEASLYNNNTQKKKEKNKIKKNKQISEKEACESRAKVTYEDLNSFNFSRANLVEKQVDIIGISQNEDLYNKITRSQLSQKRTRKHAIDNRQQANEKDCEVKRKRKNTV